MKGGKPFINGKNNDGGQGNSNPSQVIFQPQPERREKTEKPNVVWFEDKYYDQSERRKEAEVDEEQFYHPLNGFGNSPPVEHDAGIFLSLTKIRKAGD